jgi:ABC-type Na+ efflux pump permease subunit
METKPTEEFNRGLVLFVGIFSVLFSIGMIKGAIVDHIMTFGTFLFCLIILSIGLSLIVIAKYYKPNNK